MAEHSELPWRLSSEVDAITIVGNDTEIVCTSEFTIEGESNASYIVRACNSFPELVGALDDLLNCASGPHDNDWIRRSTDRARAALSRANGE